MRHFEASEVCCRCEKWRLGLVAPIDPHRRHFLNRLAAQPHAAATLEGHIPCVKVLSVCRSERKDKQDFEGIHVNRPTRTQQ